MTRRRRLALAVLSAAVVVGSGGFSGCMVGRHPAAPAPAAAGVAVAPAAASSGGGSGAVPSEAIVWVADASAPHGLRSEWLRLVPGSDAPASGRAAPGATVERVASRPGPVLVGRHGLFVLGTHPVRGAVCVDCVGCQEEGACASPGVAEVAVPDVRELGGEPAFSPWDRGEPPGGGCEVADWQPSFELQGAVGSILLGVVHGYAQYCGAAHGMYTSEPFALDLDTGAHVRPELPAGEVARLRAAVHPRFLVEHGECLLDAEQAPEPWWVTLAWSSEGALIATQQFTMGAPYVCGTGPGHYSVLLEEQARGVPPLLGPWRLLPAWVAAWRAAHDGRWAFALSAEHAGWLARFRG